MPTSEAIGKANATGVPEVISAMTGVYVADRRVRKREGSSENVRRVSVSGGSSINEFTSKYSGEQASERRQSCANSASQGNMAAAAALAVPERLDEEDEDEGLEPAPEAA